MSISFFLGANSKDGFFSLYSGFAAGEGDKLHIIKSGPGTGKSGFMRSIGKKAEDMGYAVQYVLCSGDPSSLDGVYIPRLHQGWVDGTAPHVLEPRRFGVDSDYVNLGQFFRNEFSSDEGSYVNLLYTAYQAQYKTAYSYLSAAGHIKAAQKSIESTAAELRPLVRDILEKAEDLGENAHAFHGKCFLSAISCMGTVRLNGIVNELCKLIYSVGEDRSALSIVCEEARRAGLETMLCFSPLEPDVLEAVIIPRRSLAFISGECGAGFEGAISLLPSASEQSDNTLLVETLSIAIEHLKSAKALHDKLEAHYIAHMDFAALTDYTQREKAKLFG